MAYLNFKYNGDAITVKYERINEENNNHFDVFVDAADNGDIEPYTSSSFRISLSNGDNILSYPVNGPTDLEIKGNIISALFKQENIDF